MPSQRSPKPSPAGEGLGQGVLLLVLLLAAVSIGCRTARAPRAEAPPPVPPDLSPFLISPETGYPLALGSEVAARIEEGYRTGARTGRPAVTRSIANELLDLDRDLEPAFVLQAQAAVLEGRFSEAAEWAARAVESHPQYTAAQLVLGRASEELGQIPRAYAAYRSVSDRSQVARKRTRTLEPRVEEILRKRALEALDRNRVQDATRTLEELRLLVPDSPDTLELLARVHRAADRSEEELRTLRKLRKLRDGDPELSERLAELEVEVGDPGAALEILEALQSEFPDRRGLEELEERAKFRWRLRNLPGEVQEILEEPRLSRGDYAVLLYWMVPAVRAATNVEGRIATDILDHPHRRRIARVVNLGLMDLTPGTRGFEPERAVRRVDALESLLGVLAKRNPVPACVMDWARSGNPSTESSCETAAACGFLREASECLPGGEVSSDQAVEWIGELASF
ncbi:MAG: hypothetical protein R3234_05825 [Thermoanaerobaculia bacterium]|nr:hypothetical protein [Thermoanaerobaculia bacterium]